MQNIRFLLLIIGIVLQLTSAVLLGQEVPPLDLQNLRVPVSPAWVMAGNMPAVIDRPETPRALALSLANATQSGRVLPEDYGLEFAPYWLIRHPELTFSCFYRPSFGQSLRQNAAVSLAIRQGDGTDETVIGLGVRTLLVPGKAPQTLWLAAREIQMVQTAAVLIGSLALLDPLPANSEEFISALRNQFELLKKEPAKFEIPELTPAKKSVLIDRLEKLALQTVEDYFKQKRAEGREIAVEDALVDLEILLTEKIRQEGIQKLRQAEQERRGFILETGLGSRMLVPEQVLEKMQLQLLSLWLTVAYQKEETPWGVVFHVRFWGGSKKNSHHYLDLGCALHWRNGNFSLLLEWLQRQEWGNAVSGRETHLLAPFISSSRILLMTQYRIQAGIYLQFSFGKDFKQRNIKGNLIARLGISIGLGKRFLRISD